MSKFKIGDEVVSINKDRKSFGRVGKIIKDLKNGHYVTDISINTASNLSYHANELEPYKNHIIYQIIQEL